MRAPLGPPASSRVAAGGTAGVIPGHGDRRVPAGPPRAEKNYKNVAGELFQLQRKSLPRVLCFYTKSFTTRKLLYRCTSYVQFVLQKLSPYPLNTVPFKQLVCHREGFSCPSSMFNHLDSFWVVSWFHNNLQAQELWLEDRQRAGELPDSPAAYGGFLYLQDAF